MSNAEAEASDVWGRLNAVSNQVGFVLLAQRDVLRDVDNIVKSLSPELAKQLRHEIHLMVGTWHRGETDEVALREPPREITGTDGFEFTPLPTRITFGSLADDARFILMQQEGHFMPHARLVDQMVVRRRSSNKTHRTLDRHHAYKAIRSYPDLFLRRDGDVILRTTDISYRGEK